MVFRIELTPEVLTCGRVKWRALMARATNGINRLNNDQGLNRGLELFNRTCFFEAHEILEDVWHTLPRTSAEKKHMQGLVQLAVAFHHESRDNLRGARSVLDRALRNLAGAETSFPALDIEQLRRDLGAWQQHLAGAGPRPAPPRIKERDLRR